MNPVDTPPPEFDTFVSNPCRCSLEVSYEDDGNFGFCSSMLGTLNYSRSVASMAAMMGRSECHTMDRFNLRAQKDKKCGIGYYSDEYRMTIDQKFNMTYWPYI